MTPAHADVVCIAAATASTNAAKSTRSATHQGTQQIGIGSIGAPSELLIVRKFCLDQIELLLADDCWDLRHSGPLLLARLDMSSPTSTNGNQS
jgi:hypothetical protein